MEALARRILVNPVEVNVGGRSIVSADIEQHVVVLEEDDKVCLLMRVLLSCPCTDLRHRFSSSSSWSCWATT